MQTLRSRRRPAESEPAFSRAPGDVRVLYGVSSTGARRFHPHSTSQTSPRGRLGNAVQRVNEEEKKRSLGTT